VVLALALATSCGGQSGSGGQAAGEGEREAAAEEQAVGRPSLGDADASVVLTQHTDYQ
jgi:hypothetical protein